MTVPLPTPEGVLTVIQGVEVVAVHETPAEVVILTVLAPPVKVTVAEVGLRVAVYPSWVTVWVVPAMLMTPWRVSADRLALTTYMHEIPADSVVLGVMVSHEAAVVAVQVPVPAVRIDPPPPSLVNERVGGSMVT